MNKLQLTEDTKKEMGKAINSVILKISKDEYTTEELEDLLMALFDFFTNIQGLDYKMVKDINECNRLLKNKKTARVIETIKKSKKIKKSDSEISSKVDERLNKYFELDNNRLNESNIKDDIDTTYEVQTKYRMNGKKIYHEQEKVLLTMINSLVASQMQVNQIKNLIEQGYTFTNAIKTIMKNREALKRIKGLCKLQDERYNELTEARERLY